MFAGDLKNKQAFAADFFENVFKSGKLAKAYLFVGDAPEDKIKLAKTIAKILNCDELKASGELKEPCGVCTNCKWIDSDTHPMTPLYLKAPEESKKGIITVEAVKQLQVELAKTSQYYRVVIVPSANYNSLTKHSANALLKILEEPNSNTLFILFAEDKDMVLPTILSRTQQVKFNPNEKKEYSEEALELFQSYANKIFGFVAKDSRQEQTRLESINLAEELAANDSKLLLEFLELLQDDSLSRAQDLEAAKQVNAIEYAKESLASFVRPKTAMEKLLVGISG